MGHYDAFIRTNGGKSMESFFCDTFSNIVAGLFVTAIVAICGFVFRNKIKRLLFGNDLYSSGNIPKISIEDRQFDSDIANKDNVTFVIKNEGTLNLSKIRMYECLSCQQNQRCSIFINPIRYVRDCSWANNGAYEQMQISIDGWYLHENGRYPDSRFFIEMLTDAGVWFRATAILVDGKGFKVDNVKRVRKHLPNRSIKAIGDKQINKKQAKYDLNLSVG